MNSDKENNKMKHNIIKKLAATLTVSGLLTIIAPLTVTAQTNKYITASGTIAESGSSYQAISTQAALQVNGAAGGVGYSGTGITLTSTFNSREGAYAYNRGSIVLHSSTITTSGNNASGLYTGSGASIIGTNLTVIASGTPAIGVNAQYDSSIILTGGTVITTGENNAYALAAERLGGKIIANDLTIETSGTRARGAVAGNGGFIELTGARITTHVADVAVSAHNGGTMTVNNSIVNAANIGVRVGSTCTIIFNDTDIISTGTFPLLNVDSNGGAYLEINGGTLANPSGQLLDDWNVTTGHNEVVLNNVDASAAGGIINNANSGELELTVNGGSGINGNMTNSGSGALTVNLNNSTLTGSGTVSNDGALTVNMDNNSTWTMTADSQVTNLALSNSGKVVFQKGPGFKTLTTTNLSGSGAFEMNTDIAAGDADRLTVSGTSAGNHQVRITNHGVQTTGNEAALLLIETADGQAKFSGTVSVGMFDYSLYQDQTDWYLSVSGTNLPPNPPDPDPDPTPDPDPQPPTPPTPPTPPSISDGGKIILIVPPSIGQNWFDHTKTISNHLGDLRDDKAGILEALWVRSYGAQLNIAPSMVGSGVREYQYGVDIGSDHRWNLDKDDTLIVGGFVGYGRIDRTLRNGFGSTADTDNYHAGLYAIWQHECGLWADIIAKGQYADSQLSAWDASQNHMTASYGNWGGGVTLDVGKKFSFSEGWFIEPSLSAGYAHFMGNNYTTGGANQFAVNISDADLFQFRVGVAFGRTLKLKNSGVLQPYIKVAGVEQVSTGGKLRASGHEWRPNFDGTRAEVGGGIIWQLNADHQLSLDYEASFGDKYDKPWGLTAGYRYQF